MVAAGHHDPLELGLLTCGKARFGVFLRLEAKNWDRSALDRLAYGLPGRPGASPDPVEWAHLEGRVRAWGEQYEALHAAERWTPVLAVSGGTER